MVWIAGVNSCITEDRLFTELLKTRQYQKLSRPVANVDETTIVTLGMVVEKIIELVSINN